MLGSGSLGNLALGGSNVVVLQRIDLPTTIVLDPSITKIAVYDPSAVIALGPGFSGVVLEPEPATDVVLEPEPAADVSLAPQTTEIVLDG